MRTGILWQAVYWLSLPALAVLTVVLLRRKLVGKFPFFFFYIATGFLIDLARLFTFRSRPIVYYHAYWISEAVGTLFGFLATLELILARLFPYFYKVRFYRYFFSSAGIVIACFAVITAYLTTSPLLLSILTRTLHTFDFLRVVILIFFVGLMLFMGRHWDRYEFGITLGLGINAAALLVFFAFPINPRLSFLMYLPVFAYDAACLIWLISFAKPEKATSVEASVSPEIVQEAQQWEKTLKRSWTGKKSSQ